MSQFSIGTDNGEDVKVYVAFAVGDMNNTWHEETVECLGYSDRNDAVDDAHSAIEAKYQDSNDVSFFKMLYVGE